MIEPMGATAAETAELEARLRSAGFEPRAIQPLSGDVSPRRYFRTLFADGGSAILATYPSEVRDTCRRFLRTTTILDGAGVRVPRVLASDCAAGWMLVEDLGPQTLAEWGKTRPWNEVGACFEHALELADRISRLPPKNLADLNPRLGREILVRELAQTWDLLLEPRGLVRDPGLAADLRAGLGALCERLGAEPPVPCHRDFMVRNLMPLPEAGKLAVLDHQDLRLGPPLYDLASLLNDTLFPPPEAERALLAAVAAEPGGGERYARAAAQRTLKAVGTYASFARRGASRHLPLIGPTLARFVEHFGRLPEGEGLAARLADAWSPALVTPRTQGIC
jgi:aminoglycoside/choline kinase family phosphotransferase